MRLGEQYTIYTQSKGAIEVRMLMRRCSDKANDDGHNHCAGEDMEAG